MNHAMIRGMGWVSESSRGYPGQVLYSKEPLGLPRISGKEILDRPHKAFGRMDPFSKIGFAAITFALADAGIARSESKKNIAVIASSVTGCLETDITYQATLSREKGILPSPILFAYTLSSCFLGEASIYHGLAGESFMVEEETPNGLQGLSLGLDLLEDEGCDALVYGLCNSNIKGVGPSINTAFQEPGALFFVFEKQNSRPGHGIITENRSQNIFSHGNKKIDSLTDLGKNILAKKTN